MTSIERAGIDTDRIDGDRNRWRMAAALTGLGLILGAILGGLYGHSRAARYRASTALSVLPDSAVNTQQAVGAPTQDATSFVQSQLVVLNGMQLVGQVQRELRLPSAPAVSSTQVGQTYVIELAATASTRAQAVAVATATARAYAQQRTKSLTDEINSSVSTTTKQLATVAQALKKAQASTPVKIGVTPSQTALETEYERLLGVSSALGLELQQVPRVTTVLTPASIGSTGLSPVTKDTVGGALLGGLIGLTLAILARRFSTRLRSVADLSAIDVPVLLPVMPRRSGLPGRGRGGAARLSAGRLLAARLTASARPNQPLIVVGPTPHVGTSYVATSLAAALAQRAPVLLVLSPGSGRSDAVRSRAAADSGELRPATRPGAQVGDLIEFGQASSVDGVWLLPLTPQFAGLNGAAPTSAVLDNAVARAVDAGWLVVIDAPALSESDLALRCTTGAVALVVGRGVSRPADVLSSVDQFPGRGNHLAGVIFNDVPGPLARLLTRRTRRMTGPATGASAAAAPPVAPPQGSATAMQVQRSVPVESPLVDQSLPVDRSVPVEQSVPVDQSTSAAQSPVQASTAPRKASTVRGSMTVRGEQARTDAGPVARPVRRGRRVYSTHIAGDVSSRPDSADQPSDRGL